jgi:hypothetical protein
MVWGEEKTTTTLVRSYGNTTGGVARLYLWYKVNSQNMSSSSSARELFGGAITAEIGENWLDASDARPVPDHQEVWLERDADLSLVIEILERAEAADADCAAFHFEDVAGSNEAVGTSVIRVTALPIVEMHHSLHQAGPCYLLHGLQTLPRANTSAGPLAEMASAASASSSSALASEGLQGPCELSVQMAIVRLAAQETDLMVSLNRPCAPSTGAERGAADAELLLATVRSLEIRDWGLFGG